MACATSPASITRCSRTKLVNKDPREVYLAQLFKERGETNVFHDFYSALVQALYDNGVTPTSSASTSTP